MSAPQHDKRKPISISPTPLRDWVARQPRKRKIGLVALFTALIASGGQAAFSFSFSPVPATQQLVFVLLAGALLGSRLGAVASLAYLLGAAVTGRLWPAGAGESPLTGPLAGYLWSLPAVSYVCGAVVERVKQEAPIVFALAAAASIAVFDAAGTLRLLGMGEMGVAEAVVKGVGFFTGLHLAQGALVVLVASGASSALRARDTK